MTLLCCFPLHVVQICYLPPSAHLLLMPARCTQKPETSLFQTLLQRLHEARPEIYQPRTQHNTQTSLDTLCVASALQRPIIFLINDVLCENPKIMLKEGAGHLFRACTEQKEHTSLCQMCCKWVRLLIRTNSLEVFCISSTNNKSHHLLYECGCQETKEWPHAADPSFQNWCKIIYSMIL